MVVVCSFCRDMVHVSSGRLLSHGLSHHGVFSECAGSGTPYCESSESCCG